MTDKIRLNFYLNTKLHEALAEIAERDDRSISDLIREACRQYVFRDKRKGTSKFFKGVIDEQRDDAGGGEFDGRSGTEIG